MRTAPRVTLTETERRQLNRYASGRHVAVRLALRAKIVLQCEANGDAALVVLVWPALIAAAGLRQALPSWGRSVIYLAAALGLLQTVLPTPFAHRLFHVLGTDALLASLLIVGLLSRWLVGNEVESADKVTREAIQTDQPQ